MQWNNIDTTQAFKKLAVAKPLSVKEALSQADAVARINKYRIALPYAVHYNYAAKPVNTEILSLLQALSDEQAVVAKYQTLLDGAVINTGENRKVLHHLARGQLGARVECDGLDMAEFYNNELARIDGFCTAIHNQQICSASGKPFTDVVQIGIGGSDLGPRASYLALQAWAKTEHTHKMHCHFISNVDPDDGAMVLDSLGEKIHTTLFILVSKSGTTAETLANELFVRQYLKEHHIESDKHMVVVTSKTSPLATSTAFIEHFFIDDFIGGRYSTTSACGILILSLAFGFAVSKRFLEGAHEADKHALNPDIYHNAPLLDALIGVYERNILNYDTTAVLPYSQALSRFPAHLQQLDMESNGKSVNRFGQPIAYKTGPVIFGEPGTNGQHSFYQLLHQGTDIIPLQFIAFTHQQTQSAHANGDPCTQDQLNANVVAQIIAFACGQENANPNKTFAGNRPSSLLHAPQLSPEVLGVLFSHFENKVMFQGFLWNINSFDQEGVQLGKILAKQVLQGTMPPALQAYASLLQ